MPNASDVMGQQCLAPYVAMEPDHSRPILFLDSYRCHDGIGKISELGVEVLHIPDG